MDRWPSRRWLICGGAAALALSTIVVRTSVGSSEVESPGGVRLRAVDGGEDYYGRFAHGLPSDPGYFPLGVWFESVAEPANVNADKDVGLNLYVSLTADSDLALVRSRGMKAILQDGWQTKEFAGNASEVAGWILSDEIDMTQGPDGGYAALQKLSSQFPDDRRLRVNNYGKGVMFWQSEAQAARFVNDFQEVVSSDVYWFTDPNVSVNTEGGKLLNGGRALTPAQTRRASNYGYTVDRMRRLTGGSRPVWNIVEVGWPAKETAEHGGRAIQPAEVRAAVWHSIIAGARGIIYFNHSFGGPNPSYHSLRDPAYAPVRAAVKGTNHLIAQLAPVLNAPFADGFVGTNPAVRAMAKFHDGKYYVFAGSKEDVASTATFSLSGIDNGVATAIGENRTLPISNGRFSDGFGDGNAIHIYRIDNP